MMIFTSFARERKIRQVLRSLTRQRIASVLQPGNVWVIENAPELPGQKEALNTCLMRGWIEVLHEAVPKGQLEPDELHNPNFDPTKLFNSRDTIYRITDSGWAVVNRTHTWVLATFFVALLALVATIVQLWQQ